ncbi:protein-P-II uridylyltransferase [Arcobacter venerupis]|uniref:Bifunctional uridylyltransferase/uridylyl-removing enzyme n=1 Tax=Arcobacter venerupis TaxID=1054033 RepID=A0AAE7E336_9BACT|nr:HD domain-containing protein [Arcobacter venerupis]QKF65904.1 protein-P-II uridylyltransferase [Arcobacter venerupis]RWS49263.1 protein-PII uridylyltransferase [Arcobacter venerupis]
MIDLNIQIEELISNNATDFQISKVFKTYYKNYLDSIDTTVETTGGKDFFIKHTKHTDKFLILLYKYILRKNFASHQPMSTSIPISLIALGSYGREQLCIYSDIDIMILYENIKGYNLKAIMEEFITLAWDCGLKLGSRVHELKEVSEAVKEDITIKSSILESRLIYGSKILWYGYENVLSKIRKTNQKGFILDKLEEHKQRLLKYPLTMEPNIKDGYGGIRESNMMYWMANILYGATNTKELIGIQYTEDEYKKYRQALEFIFQVRNALHNIARKKLDQVTLDVLPDLSLKLGFKNKPRYTKDRQCMSKILSCLHIIHNFTATMVKKFTRETLFDATNIIKLKKLRFKKNLYILDNTLYCSFHRKEQTLNSLLKELIELPLNVERFDRSYIYYASKVKLPNVQTKELKKNIKTILCKPNLYPLMKLIYNAGLFQAVLPSTKKIIDQPQFDGYHTHPVDIHSLKTLKFSQNIENEYIKSIFEELTSEQKILVRLVSFFHDIGKGRTDDHHILGEKLFKSMMKSFDFSEEFIKLGARLVRYHNMMSYMATHEDIYSEKTILNFTGLIKTKEALKLLYAITYSDISAVGKNIFNSSTESLLKQLYLQSLPAFENEDFLNESKRRIAKQNAIKKLDKYKELPVVLQKKIMYIASNQIFLRLKAEDILDIAIKAKDVDTYIYKIINDSQLTIRIIRKSPLNLGYLLGKLEFLNIASMNIFKLYDNKKAFDISFSEKIDTEDLFFIEEIIKDSFDMSKTTITKTPIINRDGIKIDCNHSSYLASMQLIAKDQKGLFAYIARIFDDFNLDIESAKLHTLNGYARDLILIEKNGNFCSKQEEVLDLICVNEEKD